MEKVLIIVPNLRLGGQERIAVRTAELLKKKYEVSLVIFDEKEGAYSYDGNLINLNVPAKHGKLFKIWNVLKRAYQLRGLKRREKIDFSYSFGESANIVNILSRGKDKAFLSIHGYADLKNRLLDRFLYKRSDKTICCSEEIKMKYELLFPKLKNSVTLYNPYPVNEILEMAEEEVLDYDFKGMTIITHGRLEEVKNYPRLIRSFALAQKKVENLHLLILGEGSKRQELETLVHQLDLEEKVHFLGLKRNPFSYLRRADLYVLSSFHEGFPNALAEGMVFMPAVSVDCKSGPKEMLDQFSKEKIERFREGKYGILVSEEEPDSSEEEKKKTDFHLSEAMLFLLNNEKKYLEYQSLARQRVLEFSDERYQEKLITVFREEKN